MDKLLPCPFCGQKPRIKNDLNSEGKPFYQVRHDCVRFLSMMETFCYRTEEIAIAAWNRRTQPENKPLTLDELKQMDGEPVWITGIEKWGVLGQRQVAGDWHNQRRVIGFAYGWEWFDDVLRGRSAYRSKPKEVANE